MNLLKIIVYLMKLKMNIKMNIKMKYRMKYKMMYKIKKMKTIKFNNNKRLRSYHLKKILF